MFAFTRRSGAIASAAIVFAFLSGTGLSGAVAQDQAEPTMLETATTAPEAAAGEPRFVSEPVVQDLPATETDAARARDGAASLRDLVAAMPAGGELSPELECLAQAVYFESRGEPLDGQLAVARVIINRAESSQFPQDYCGVVTQRGQFSFVRGGHIPSPNLSSPAWQRARAIARIAHQELWDSAAGDALYFHAGSVRPAWTRRLATVARIDSHVFYR